MKEKALFSILLVCMILSTVIMVYVLKGIDNVRAISVANAPGGFISLMQMDNGLDNYSNALEEYRINIGDQDLMQSLSSLYQKQFNIVWGNLNSFTLKFHQYTDEAKQLVNFKHDATQFLQRHESTMAADQILTTDQVSLVLQDLSILQAGIHELSYEYFSSYLSYRDKLHNDINRLHKLLYIFSAALIGSACMLVALLVRSNTRKNALVKDAVIARHDQTIALQELRSGRLEQRAKDSFIASASHDLSQPLHALGIFLGSLDIHITNPEGKETLHDAIQCSNNVGYLFKSLLDISRLDAGIVEVEKKHFYLDELITMLEQEYRSKASNAGFDMDIRLDNTVIHTDPILLSRIVRNLIENALTHSGGSQITISSTNLSGQHLLNIEDNGSGIPEGEQKRIFSEYYQINKSTPAQTKGLGLGLSIINRLAELLGMKISLTSKVGQFSRFSMTLPLGIESKVDRVANSAAYNSVVAIEDNIIVAVVDDDEAICTAMSTMLSNMGIEAVTATSTDSLIDKLIESQKYPHLLVADYRLSKGQTGDQAIVQLKRALNVQVPALLVTGDSSPMSVANATSSGFDLLHKPIASAELSAKIIEMLHTSALAAEGVERNSEADKTSQANVNQVAR